MNMINRNNYEEFFLMYVDNELPAYQRAEVEFFVEQNPDLQQEFETLKQAVLFTDDALMFNDKQSLLKMNTGIGIDNYEEYFLLDIDGELNEKEHAEVEQFILLHPELQPQFTLLKQTVLEPEQITFTDKQSLYRKEERRVIPFTWMRMAVAAALIGIAVLVWWMLPAGTDNNNLAIVQQPGKTTIAPVTNDTEIKQQPAVKPEQQNNNDVAALTARGDKKNSSIATPVKIKTTQNSNKATAATNNNIAANSTGHNKQNSTLAQEVIVPQQKEDVIAYNAPVNNNNNGMHTQTAIENTKQQDIAANSIIQPVVYKELNTDDDKDQSLYVGNLNLNKNKLRGVIKKVGGLFAAKSKTALASNEQGKLQVAGLEFNKN